MPQDPETVRQDVVQEKGMHDIVVLSKHEGRVDHEGNLLPDEYKEFDLWRAGRVMEVLRSVYPGHLWTVVSDTAQGIVKISIPILMGVSNWMVINLKTHELTPGLVIASGGEILERYGLRRGRFELGSFLDAREKHSALVTPGRKVPG